MGTYREELEKLAGIDFFQLAKGESHPRTKMRLLALGYLQAGKTKSEVIDMFQIVFPTLRDWLLRFIAEGVPGLREKEGKGRKRKLSPAQEEEFKRHMEELQKSRPGRRIRGVDVQALLKEKFSIEHALPSVYNLLERCGFSSLNKKIQDKSIL